MSTPDPRLVVSTPLGSIAVIDLPLACCGLESARAPWVEADGDPVAVALCISGTITAKSASMVQARITRLAEEYPGLPVYRVAVGACAASGGPYWDSPSVLPGHEVELMVPGCPPSPAAIAEAVCSLGSL